MTTTPAAAYQLNPDGSIDLYVYGTIALRVGETVSIPPLPTKKLQRAVMAELTNAMHRGAAHGECDSQREIANALNQQGTPGHVYYTAAPMSRRMQEWGIWRCVDDEETRLFADMKIRPKYLEGSIINELERAFRIGGRFGADIAA
jgi:hypothetical protein